MSVLETVTVDNVTYDMHDTRVDGLVVGTTNPGVDLNTLTETGLYTLGDYGMHPNIPKNSHGNLTVLNNGAFKTQIFYAATGEVFFRLYTSGQWNAWQSYSNTIGSGSLNTTSQTLIGAVNELYGTGSKLIYKYFLTPTFQLVDTETSYEFLQFNIPKGIRSLNLTFYYDTNTYRTKLTVLQGSNVLATYYPSNSSGGYDDYTYDINGVHGPWYYHTIRLNDVQDSDTQIHVQAARGESWSAIANNRFACGVTGTIISATINYDTSYTKLI